MKTGHRHWATHLAHPAVVLLLAVGFFCALRYLDTRWRFLPYTFAVTFAVAALVYLLSRRPAFSLYLAGAFTLLLALASKAKHDLKGFALHYYDLVFTALDGSAVAFLVTNYGGIFLGGLLALSGVAAILCIVFLAERPRAPRFGWRAGLLTAATGIAVALFPAPRPKEPSYLPYIDGYNASSFYLSLGDIALATRDVKIRERIPSGVDARFPSVAECGAARRPDVVTVLSESQADPDLFPGIAQPEGFRDLFASADGVVRPLYVESFGGGTWVTNFSVMTGLSAADFGWQSSYVTQVMENRVRGTLAEVLSRCGYRTVTVMPMPYQFVNEGAFLKSIGFQEIYDADALGLAAGATPTDRVYFAFAEKLIEEHRRRDPRPLFLSVQTLFPHGPYDVARVPPGEVPAFTFSQDAEINEYMHRVVSSRIEFHRFLSGLKERPGARGTVVLEYGDHQSVATRPHLEQAGELSLSDMHSPAYRTFLSVHAFGAELDARVFDEPMDAGFLSAALVEAAGLPSSPLLRGLSRLRKACGGRYHDCERRDLIDRHLAMRVNGGLLLLN